MNTGVQGITGKPACPHNPALSGAPPNPEALPLVLGDPSPQSDSLQALSEEKLSPATAGSSGPEDIHAPRKEGSPSTGASGPQ